MFGRKKKEEPKKPRFHVRAYPTGYGIFKIVITDRSRDNYEIYNAYLPVGHSYVSLNKNSGRTIERGGFKSRTKALDFAYRIIRIRTRWETYKAENTVELEINA